MPAWIPRTFADAIIALGFRCERHRAHFPPGTEDPVWISAIGSHGWIGLSSDKDFRSNPLELGAISLSKARVFVVAPKEIGGMLQAGLVLKHVKAIARLAMSTNPPLLGFIGYTKIGIERVSQKEWAAAERGKPFKPFP